MKIFSIKAAVLAATLATGFAGVADAHRASSHDGSRMPSVRLASPARATANTGDKHTGDKHRAHHRHRFAFFGLPNYYWLAEDRFVVRRIGPDGYPVRRVVPCRFVIPATAARDWGGY